MRSDFRAGDRVIYRKTKYSARPSPHAKMINPAANGDSYCYEIDKFWIVTAVQPDRKIVVCTRRGKRHMLDANDPALRRAHWWERLLFRSRFPALKTTSG